MHDIILFNFIIFAIFLSAFLIEVGLALLLLIDFKDKEKIMRYLVPVWEIDGTFGVFYLVDTEATFPTALVPIGFLYIIPIMLAGIIFVFRNSFFGYSEFISNKVNEKKYLRVYAISIIFVAFLAMSVLNSTVSGIGVNLSSYSLNVLQSIFNGFNIMLFIGEALLALFADMLIFRFSKRIIYPIAIVVLSLLFIISSLYVGNLNYLISNMYSEYYLLAIPIILIAISLSTYAYKERYTKFAVPITLFISILSFELLEYPGLFNDKLAFASLLVTPSTQPLVLAFGIVGGLIIAFFLVILLRLGLSGSKGSPEAVDKEEKK